MKSLKLFFEFENGLSLVYKIKDHYRQNKSWMIIHFIDNILKCLQQDSEKQKKEEEILEDIGLQEEYKFLTSIIKKYKELPDAFSEEYIWKIFDDLEEEQVIEEQVEKEQKLIEEKFLRIMIYCNLKNNSLNEVVYKNQSTLEVIQLTYKPVTNFSLAESVQKKGIDFNSGFEISNGVLLFGDSYGDYGDFTFTYFFNQVNFTLLTKDISKNDRLKFCSKIYGLQGTKITSDTFKVWSQIDFVDFSETDISETVNLTTKIGLFNDHPHYLTITGLKDFKLPPLIFSKCYIQSIDLTNCDISEAQFLFSSSRIRNIIGLEKITKKNLPISMFSYCIFENINLRLNPPM